MGIKRRIKNEKSSIVPGITMICKYVYWSKPENKVKYNEKVKIEKIKMADERKIMLRDKSGLSQVLIRARTIFISENTVP